MLISLNHAESLQKQIQPGQENQKQRLLKLQQSRFFKQKQQSSIKALSNCFYNDTAKKVLTKHNQYCINTKDIDIKHRHSK